MRNKIIVILCFFSLTSVKSNAQQWTTLRSTKDTVSIGFKLAYWATLKHPGFTLGVEIPLTRKHFIKGDKLKKVNEQHFTSNFGFYHHKTFHNNFIMSAGYQFRRTNSNLMFVDFNPQIGINRTLLDETTYKVDNNGKVSEVSGTGYWYFNAQLGFSIGKDFSSTKTRIPLKIYIKPNLILMLPYNNYFYVRPIIEIGVSYCPAKGISKLIKSKVLSKKVK